MKLKTLFYSIIAALLTVLPGLAIAADINIGTSPASWGDKIVEAWQSVVTFVTGPGKVAVIVLAVAGGLAAIAFSPREGGFGKFARAATAAVAFYWVAAYLVGLSG